MRVFAVLLFLCCAAPVVHSQDRIKFDPMEHLEGFAECYFSDHSDFHDFEHFQAFDGDRISATRLDQLRHEWKADQEKAHGESDRLQADPMAAGLRDLERQLRQDPFFSRISYTVDTSLSPFVFLIQKPDKERRNYNRGIVEFYGPWFQALNQVWERDYVAPLRLQRQKDYGPYVVFVLSSHGDYVNYAEALRSYDLYMARAHYDPERRIAVTYEDPFGAGNDEKEKLRSALHEVVHAIQHAYGHDREELPPHAWFNEGLAEYLSSPAYHVTSEKRLRFNDGSYRLEALAQIWDTPWQDVFVLPVAELAAAKNYNDLLKKVGQRMQKKGLNSPEWEPLAMQVFYAQSTHMMFYLHDGDGGKYREATLRYVGDVLRGESDPFKTGFRGVSLEDVDRRFAEAVDKELKKRWDFGGREAAGKAAASAGPSRPAPDLAALAVTTPEPSAAIGLALEIAGQGDLAAASQRLEKVIESAEGEWRDRATRERDRIQGLAELRDTFLSEWRKTGKNLRLVHDGKNVYGKITAIESGEFELSKTRGAPFRVPISALDPKEMVDWIESKKLSLGDAEMRAYGLALAGDSGYRKLLVSASDRALKDDVESMPELLQQGRNAAVLADLAAGGIPGDEASAERTLDLIRTLFQKPDAQVKARGDDLRNLAAATFEVLAEARHAELFETNVPAEDLGDGKVRLTYSFESKQELEDFESVEYLEEMREMYPTLQNNRKAEWNLGGGSLRGVGRGCLRHKLGFIAPMTVEIEVTTKSPSGAAAVGSSSMDIGLCDDGHGSHISCSDAATLYVLDKASGHQQQVNVVANLFMDTKYTIKVEHDGAQVMSHMDGRKLGTMPAGPRRSGGVFLWLHSDLEKAIAKLTITGKLDPAFLARRKTEWVDEQMKEFAE